MAVSALDDKAVRPTDEMVAVVLNDVYPLWKELSAHVAEQYPSVSSEWKHYGKAAGWAYVVKSKKRTLIYMIPCEGYMRTRLVFGEKAAECVCAADVPDDIKDALRTATAYAEGRSIDVDVQNAERLNAIKTLLSLKYEN